MPITRKNKVTLNQDAMILRRESLSLSQQEAAKRAGMSLQQWHRLEKGKATGLSADVLYRLAMALGCPMESLLRI